MSESGSRIVAPTLVITPRRGWFQLGLAELWRYRELGYFLVWRDLKVRYKQTVIGALWAIINPIVLMVVFTFVFGRIRPTGAEDVPGPIWYYAALLPWTYFAHSLSHSANSILGAQNVIKKVYFPRLMLPVAATLPGIVDFAMSFLVLLGLMVAYDVPLTLRLAIVPFLLLICALTALGAGLWFSATNALYRDVKEGVPFLIQILMFTSPLLLNIDRIPEWFRPIYSLNPVVGVIEASRWAVTGIGSFPWEYALPGLLFIPLLFFTGLIYFRRIEDVIVDVV